MPLKVAVVLEAQVDEVLDAGLPDALRRRRVLLREIVVEVTRQPRGGAAWTQAAPAGADLQHVVARAEVELLADRVELGELRLLERRLARSKKAHEYIIVGSSIELEEVVAEVVVGGDVLAAPLRRVAEAARTRWNGSRTGRARGGGRRAAALRAATRIIAVRSGVSHSPSM